MKRGMTASILVLLVSAGAALAREKPVYLNIKNLNVKGQIEGENITFTIDLTAEAKKGRQEIALVAGDMVLLAVAQPEKGGDIRYDPTGRVYYMSLQRSGTHKICADFAARPVVIKGGPWRESVFSIPASRMRKLEVECDRTDLEVVFPGALRLNREMRDGKLVITAILGPGRPFAVRWKPQVGELEGKLVLSSEANTIATASAGTLRLDTLFVFDISQGKLRELAFSVPGNLSVTQVYGSHIREWRIEEKEGAQTLSVILNRALTKQYALQVVSETALPEFPAEIALPVVQPEGGIRAGGYLAVGTDSAIHLLVEKTGGLSQIDASAFRRIVLERKRPRKLPASKVFYYVYASSPYRLEIKLDDIVPSFDVSERIVANVREDDLTLDVKMDVDVRDAPIRNLIVEVPGSFVVAAVSGGQVEEEGYAVRETDGNTKEVEIDFRRPVLGRTVVKMRLEFGKGPLDAVQKIGGLAVQGAKNERGYLVVVTEKGVQLETPKPVGLRPVHTGSVPMRVANAELAYRFRDKGWLLELLATKKPSGIRVESFHLVSLGEGVVYGSVAVNYFITGAPVDELYFRIPDGLKNVEFVGRDVSRWDTEGEKVTVKLQRKVIGDYNIGVSYSQRFEEGEGILAGGVACDRVETQTGYIVIASHLNLNLTTQGKPDASLLEIDRQEVPSSYRLLVNAPVLRTYKYVGAPHSLSLGVRTYARGALLPVVIEVMQIETEVAVGERKEAETVTRIRYKIKNSTNQFLPLVKPEGAEVWGAHLIELDSDGAERRVRLSFGEDEKGFLMIPLARRRNPNDPITLEVEYGQEHGRLGLLGRLKLAVPFSSVRSTFVNWKVKVPEGWSIHAGSKGNMIAEERQQGQGDLSLVMEKILRSWMWAVGRGTPAGAKFAVVVVALGVLTFVFVWRRRAFAGTLTVTVLILLLLLGIRATQSPFFSKGLAWRDDLSTITFTQALNIDEGSALAVSAYVVPQWRQHATFRGSMFLPLVALACLVLAFIKGGWRPGAIAFAVTAVFYALSQFPVFAVPTGHVLTWGVPVAIAAFLVWRGAAGGTGFRFVPGAATYLLIGLFLMTGCNSAGAAKRVSPGVSDRPILKDIECELKAEKDSMEVDLHLEIDTGKPISFPVLGGSPILLSPQRPSRAVRLKESAGQYYVHVERRGKYELDLKFLSPLEAAGDDQLRRFRMPMPLALTNRVQLTVPEAGMEIEAPTAVRMTKKDDEKSTVATAVLGPGDEAIFIWRPRARKTHLEETSFFSEVTSLVRFDTGLVEGRHRIDFQIAQGELKDIAVRVPDNVMVTSVDGEDVGAWRFDPGKHELEVRLSKPASGRYCLTVVTQLSIEEMPYTVSIAALGVNGSVHERWKAGLLTEPSVYIVVKEHPQTMNVDDFIRSAAPMFPEVAALSAGDIRHAYHTQKMDETVSAEVHGVCPELRAKENAAFSVGDDRLVYNGEVAVEAAKAGVFSCALRIPAQFDVDALSAAEVSHWDESVAGDVRTIQVHFKKKLLGRSILKVALSRPESELPPRLIVPRVEVAGALKHTGQIIISSARGVRLSVAERKGISEINPLELGIRTQGTLAFRLLRPEWELVLSTEVIQPRVNVDFLHVAEVTEGLVRHAHYMRYRLHNAGSKIFEFQVPKNALGILITGPEIARREEVDPEKGTWRVELSRKWFDRPYPLTVRYETQFDMARGRINLEPVRIMGVDLQRGNVVVKAAGRVELAPLSVGDMLQPAEARNIPRKFGAGDLSDAAFCYSSTAADYTLALTGKRHGATILPEAEVLETTLSTVVTELGETINRVQMRLRVGNRRHLETRLPAEAQVWSLAVNRRSTVPSTKSDESGEKVLLVPLAQASAGELSVDVDLIYVIPTPRRWRFRSQKYAGPKFDLPLKNIKWKFYLPEGYDYYDFEGTLAVDESFVEEFMLQRYDILAYEADVVKNQAEDRKRAVEYQNRGNILAKKGRQYAAKQALENAYNYSFSDDALNEDARVQLHRLNKQQAIVGLVGARNRLRQQTGEQEKLAPVQQRLQDLGGNFSLEDAQRVQSSLSADDNTNLEQITDRIIEGQEAAAGSSLHLIISMPLRGRVIQLQRGIQVKARTDMEVSFNARQLVSSTAKKGWVWAAGIFVLIAALLSARRQGTSYLFKHFAPSP